MLHKSEYGVEATKRDTTRYYKIFKEGASKNFDACNYHVCIINVRRGVYLGKSKLS